MLERMCIICRGKAPKCWSRERSGAEVGEQLLRLVAVNGELVVDRAQNLPGRGAYVHRSTDCIIKLGQVGRVARALRISEGELSGVTVRQVVEELLQGELLKGSSSTGLPRTKSTRSGLSKGKGSLKRENNI
jgi:predicted RNA-binding protein YlxR (DUF448 family)